MKSERKSGDAESELSRKELVRRCEELQLIVDAIPAFVFYKDTENGILRVNRAVADSLGVTAEALSNTPTVRWYPEQASEYYRDDLEVITSGKPKLGIVESISLPQLGKRWFETAKLPQFDAQGRVIGIVVVSQDITDRKQLEDRLLQAQKLESIGRLAGGVAHDFNNLLTSIFGLIAVAQREVPAGSMAHEYLALLNLAAEGGANLTKQLLAFARRQIIEPQVIDLNALVLETSNLLQRVLGEDIDVSVALSSHGLRVKADANQVSQLLLNLALNARDAMPRGGTLSFQTAQLEIDEGLLRSLPDATAGNYAVLTVRDTGEGLSEEAKAHLFEPFFTTKDFGKGTGLGLAMCYGIVKQNGGHISVESKLGSGTAFSIYLPEVDAPADAAPSPRSSVPVQTGTETLLFAEDDDLVRHLAVTELSSHGYRLIVASNGEEALKAAEEHPGDIHLLITDVIMPKMGGLELARKFRKTRLHAPVLYISGYTHEALTDGAHLLRKPFAQEALLARVRAILDANTTS
ncbi:MAG TPA: ATP-binding protein [Polyangiaceae bacterium]|jgi:two-component system cell cycle sensor histidine kinase/response regulator CckA|nr:ATP-binding protein [Polyangiaceae bacterium]